MDIGEIRRKAMSGLEKAESESALDAWHAEFLGRKGKMNEALKELAEKSVEEKRKIGPEIQSLKRDLETAYAEKETKAGNGRKIDITLPGIPPKRGHLHPLTLVERDIRRIFGEMGFASVSGPELETEHYNFDALNVPKNHPARDMQDTLWVSSAKGLLMRTQTSAMQARYMEKHLPPFQIIVPGKVFRNEATDASHEVSFYQFEGLMVGPDITLANLKWTILEFSRRFFGKTVDVRFRPSYFPFTEPSVEIDMKMENGKWLEMMGAGMVHDEVFRAAEYDPKKVKGFAFGGGLDRFAMVKYGIPDIRLSYQGDERFIRQFS